MHFTLSAAFAWLLANKEQLLVAAAGVVAAASLLIKALEVLVAVLVKLFPGLQGVNGELLAIAAWLDGIAKWAPLNFLAISPKSALKVLLLVGLVAIAAPSTARADKLDWAAGPTIPLIRYDIASPVPVQVAAGAGLQLSLTLDSLKRDFLGRSWDIVSFDVMGFGSIVNGNGSQFGALSAAGGLCIFSSLACINYGHDVLSADQRLVRGPGFLLLAFSFNFALAPMAPSSSSGESWHLPRANTLYLFGGP